MCDLVYGNIDIMFFLLNREGTPRSVPEIIGWAQINGRNLLSWEERFELDVWYVDNATFLLDLRILLLTVLKVIKREGISAEGHAVMPEFMDSLTEWKT